MSSHHYYSQIVKEAAEQVDDQCDSVSLNTFDHELVNDDMDDQGKSESTDEPMAISMSICRDGVFEAEQRDPETETPMKYRHCHEVPKP